MAAESAPRAGGEVFARPIQVNQRRYEALRAYLYEGASLRQAAARFGYTPATLETLARDLRAGKLVLFTPAGQARPQARPEKGPRPRPRHPTAPPGPVGVRDQHPAATEGVGLNCTGVGQLLAEEGFG